MSCALAGAASAQTATSTGVAVALPAGARLVLGGFVHADWVAWHEGSIDALDPETDLPLNQQRFLIRRARIGLDLDRGVFSGGLELDGNTTAGPRARLLSAYVAARWPSDSEVPYAAITVGLFKIPFGRATPEKVRDRLFLEAPTFVAACFPGEYDAGVALHGGYDVIRYAIAAMNGDPIGEAGYGGLDLDRSKDLLGRLGVDVDVANGVRVWAGASALFGEGQHPGTAATKDELVWRDVNENGLVEPSELQVLAGAASTPSVPFERFALGGDVAVAFALPAIGEVVVFGELAWAKNLDRGVEVADPIAAGRDLRELGWAIGLVSTVGPWGRVGVRYDRYDPDADAADARGGRRVPFDASRSTLSVVAEWRPLAQAALSMAYDHRDNALGRGQDGARARFPDDALTARASIGF